MLALMFWLFGRRAGFKLAAVAVALALAGCATGPEKSALLPMSWPAPPDVTRIKFVTTMGSQEDLGKEPTFSEDLLAALLGGRPPIWHLYNPLAVAVSDDGERVYVTDFSQALVYVFDLPKKKVTQLGRETKLFDRPVGIALDVNEELYVVDTFGKKVVALDRQGHLLRTITDGSLERPTGIAIDRARGRIYVADTSRQSSSNHNVKVFDRQGQHIGTVGKGKGDAQGAMLFPTYLAVDKNGNLYVSDTMNARAQVFSPDGEYLRTIGERGNVGGTFSRPKGVALDTFGNFYVVDSDWANVQIFSPKGEGLLAFGGRGRYPGLLNNPSGIAVDKNNNIYVADTQNFRVSVYQLVNTTAEDSLNTSAGQTAKGGESGPKAESVAGGGARPKN